MSPDSSVKREILRRLGRKAGKMKIRICPGCKTKVLPTQEGQCPSCQTQLLEIPSEYSAGEPQQGSEIHHGAIALMVLGGCIFAAGLAGWFRTEKKPSRRKLRLIA